MSTRDEIVVKGRKPKSGPGGLPPLGGFGRGGRGGRGEPQFAFLPPPLAPGVEEIVVTAKRQSAIRIAAARAVSALSWVGFVGFGIFELDQYRRQLERELDEKSKKEAELRRKQRLAQEQPLPEIVVTAPRPAAKAPVLPSPYFFPPVPELIPPGADPGRMIPFEPVRMPTPQPQVAPQIEVAPVTAPSIPAVRPAVAPSPGILPGIRPATLPGIRPQTLPLPRVSPRTRPSTQPQTRPAVQPAPFVSPQVSPAVRSSARTQLATRARSQSLTRAQSEALQLAASGQSTKRCPPCKKDKDEEPRTECFKKLVKEHMFPDLDQTYQWVEIDCLTGRELE